MHKIKQFLNHSILAVLSILIIPALITILYESRKDTSVEASIITTQNRDSTYINEFTSVINPEIEKIDLVGLEEYVKCVVAAEMPIAFETEALKAQAVAARTYAVNAMQYGSNLSEDEIWQAYISKEELKELWGSKFSVYWDKINKAVNETKNEILVYENQIINAVFHSTSSGYTENSENIWQFSLPYLQSVESTQDENSPYFFSQKSFSEENAVSFFQNKYSDILLSQAPLIQQIQIVERSNAGYVIKVQVGNKLLSGNDIRNLFELRSSNFIITQQNKEIIFTVKGYGHGVGMSQYGANFMALEGKNYKEILQHYYQGTEIILNNN